MLTIQTAGEFDFAVEFLFEFTPRFARACRRGDGRRVGPVVFACFRLIGGVMRDWCLVSTMRFEKNRNFIERNE